jgi:hypothetical protein
MELWGIKLESAAMTAREITLRGKDWDQSRGLGSGMASADSGREAFEIRQSK